MHDDLFESDSKVLFDALTTTTTLINEIDDLVSQYRNLLFNTSNFIVSYVSRQTNKVARNIARVSLSNFSLYIFYQINIQIFITKGGFTPANLGICLGLIHTFFVYYKKFDQ